MVETAVEMVAVMEEIEYENKYEGLHMYGINFTHFHIKSNRLGQECRHYNFHDLIRQLPLNQSSAPRDC